MSSLIGAESVRGGGEDRRGQKSVAEDQRVEDHPGHKGDPHAPLRRTRDRVRLARMIRRRELAVDIPALGIRVAAAS
jgi:hypothetical protein